MRNLPFVDAILATEPVSREDLEQELALRIRNITEHVPIEPKEEDIATTLVKKLGEVLNVGSSYCLPPPSKVKLLRMMRRRCVDRRRCAGDRPATCVKLYLEYNRKIFQLILH